MYEREDDGNCPDCNYPGIVTKGKEKNCGPYFGIYERGVACGYCGFKEKLPPVQKIKPTPIEQQPEYIAALLVAKQNIQKE